LFNAEPTVGAASPSESGPLVNNYAGAKEFASLRNSSAGFNVEDTNLARLERNG
jgi:hypothetical protein